MDSQSDFVQTSDTEEQEAILADGNRLEYFETARERIKRGFESIRAYSEALRRAQGNEVLRVSDVESAREESSPPRKRAKVSTAQARL